LIAPAGGTRNSARLPARFGDHQRLIVEELDAVRLAKGRRRELVEARDGDLGPGRPDAHSDSREADPLARVAGERDSCATGGEPQVLRAPHPGERLVHRVGRVERELCTGPRGDDHAFDDTHASRA
jgi:hypothetical protein